MKKALIYGLSAALLLASLTACSKPQANQQNTEPNPTQAAASTPEPEETVTPETNPEPLSDTIPAAHDETEDNQPPKETVPQEPEVQLFSDCNETVYATGTVNLRSGPGTSYDKVGSLTTGQSVTRTGKGIAGTEAEGWSRVVLSNGSEVYVSSNYISTTKPVQQQPSAPSSTGNQGSTSTSQPSTSSQTTSQPSTDSDGSGLTPGAQAAMEEQLRRREELYGGAGIDRGPLTPEEIAEIGSQLKPAN